MQEALQLAADMNGEVGEGEPDGQGMDDMDGDGMIQHAIGQQEDVDQRGEGPGPSGNLDEDMYQQMMAN